MRIHISFVHVNYAKVNSIHLLLLYMYARQSRNDREQAAIPNMLRAEEQPDGDPINGVRVFC
jgi:hypothetical protein